MKKFVITENDANQRLDKFLRKAAPELPSALLYKSLRNKNIKRNRKRADGNDRLQVGDIIECWLPDELFAPPEYQYDFLQARAELAVLYEDDRMLLLNKPAGLLAHPDDEGEYVDTLLGRLRRYLYEKGEYHPARENSFAPALCNRIDRNTQGIVIAAKTAEALRDLNEKIKRRKVQKFYLCAVHGVPTQGKKQKNGWRQLTHWLAKSPEKSLVRVYDHPIAGAKESKLNYRVLQEKNGLSLLEIELLTGRTHQIRAQLSHINHALVGDGKYAPRAQYHEDTANGYKQQCLCSWRLVLDDLDVRVPEAAFIKELFN